MVVILMSLIAIFYSRYCIIENQLPTTKGRYLDFLKISQGEACMSIDVFYIL